MKKIFTLIIGIVLSTAILNSQVAPPQAFSYQAVIMKSNGNSVLSNTTISLRISILQGSTIGVPFYSETLHPTTDSNGQINIVIGGGTSFFSIDWSASEYFLKVEVDIKGGTNFQVLSITQLLSVPYAMFAGTAGNALSVKYSNLIGAPLLSLVATTGQYNDLLGKPTLATVATSGSYNDLTNKPITDGSETKVTSGINVTVTGVGTSNSPYVINSTNDTTYLVTIRGTQTITGTKTFNNDLLIRSLTVGSGGGANYTNIAFGHRALISNTTGFNNTAVGDNALASITTGGRNTAYGAYTLASNTAEYDNTAFGNQALQSNKGNGNTAIGSLALFYNTTGAANTATGFSALARSTTGDANTAYGNDVLTYNTTGSGNTASGYGAMVFNTTGSDNTAFGESTLHINTTGRGNTAIGSSAGTNNATGNNNVFLGSYAGYWETGSNKLFIDNQQRADESDARNKALIYGVFDANPANQVLTVNGTLKMQNLNITNLANPVNAQDAATKAYVDASSGSATTHKIGDIYGGGIVFYVYDNGQHGLIAAIADQSTGVRWYAGTYTNTMALADGVGAGKANTGIIIANQGYGDGGLYAARICNEYQVTVDGVTYGDWYLPSKIELNLLYMQITVVGGFTSSYYWSSTESSNNSAWSQYFGNGSQSTTYKTFFAGYRVRSIRAF